MIEEEEGASAIVDVEEVVVEEAVEVSIWDLLSKLLNALSTLRLLKGLCCVSALPSKYHS